MLKKRIIAGATGFIGQHIVREWLANNYKVYVIGRSVDKIKAVFDNTVSAWQWDDLSAENAAVFREAELVLNLAGASIGDARWTEKRKKEILSSRITTTHKLADFCAKLGKQSPPLFNASAIGVYGLQASQPQELPLALDENTEIDFYHSTDFLAKVARSWELAAQVAQTAGVRVVWLRFGVVLAKEGGVLPRLRLPFQFFMGGKIGSGQQPFSWITLTDLMAAIEFLVQQNAVSGVFNLVAPGCVSQQQFAVALGKVLKRPSIIKTPAFALRLVFGEMANELLLTGQHVVPKRLLELGFKFQYPTIAEALEHIYQ